MHQLDRHGGEGSPGSPHGLDVLNIPPHPGTPPLRYRRYPLCPSSGIPGWHRRQALRQTIRKPIVPERLGKLPVAGFKQSSSQN